MPTRSSPGVAPSAVRCHGVGGGSIGIPPSVPPARRTPPSRPGRGRVGRRRQLKLSPQAQELPALGLSMVKPCFSMVSAKSIDAPSR
ncbi:hypothetical protein [Ornithinimicrobium kibberense]|uniref:hypothetical protein n=1 Tax=Ornithinimicrobium kibberense TaxID=282060 RepID=UPI00360ABDCE